MSLGDDFSNFSWPHSPEGDHGQIETLGKSDTCSLPIRHLEEQEIGQLGDVLVIGDPLVLEDVAEVPQFGDDVVGDSAHGVKP
jgi:hypothetical protein